MLRERAPRSSVDTAALLAGVANSRQPILDAAAKLLTTRGYSALTMTHIAQEAGVSRATLYRYYSTKEQLYSDLTNDWALAFVNQLHQSQPAGETVGERVHWVVEQIMDAVVENPQLVGAHIATLVSDYEEVNSSHQPLQALMPRIIALCVGEHRSENQDLAEINTTHLLISNSLLLNAGKISREAVVKSMIDICALMLSDIWDKP